MRGNRFDMISLGKKTTNYELPDQSDNGKTSKNGRLGGYDLDFLSLRVQKKGNSLNIGKCIN